jgi:3-isopropylmalate/(R)-2-methylmalate dehydratase small subunit
MKPFTRIAGIAAALPRANVDTDQIMPKQFLKGIDRGGLADGFLFDLRFERPGVARPGFVLNQVPWTRATFLVVGPNFGCGSSREHAVWGMAQLGVRAVIGTQFGGIFYDNCVRNGVPAIALASADADALMALASDAAACELVVDLPAQRIVAVATGDAFAFDFDPMHKDMLVRGVSAVDVTLESADAIRAFERDYYRDQPWLA